MSRTLRQAVEDGFHNSPGWSLRPEAINMEEEVELFRSEETAFSCAEIEEAMREFVESLDQ